MTSSKEEIGFLLDNLYLKLLDLIEQQTRCRTNIEKQSNGAQLLLAKTRYVQGTHTVSLAQIPTENSNDFHALCRVVETPNADKISKMEYTLERHIVDKDAGYVEPMNWFGVLTPGSLRTAAQQYQKCVQLVVESANLQRELVAVMEKIDILKHLMRKD